MEKEKTIKNSRNDTDFPWLSADIRFDFPDPESADENGIVCCGGNLSPGLLLSAYSQGIFPWFNDDDPIIWWSPDPRFILEPEDFHVSSSMKKLLKSGKYKISLDRDFLSVIQNCSTIFRPGQNGTWITPDMVEAYVELHRLGFAHSAEAWSEGRLVGGCYGVSLGKIFFGESMFSRESNASKAAFISLVWQLMDAETELIDCQVHTSHLESLGGKHIPRIRYLQKLAELIKKPDNNGNWGLKFPDFPKSSLWQKNID